MNEEKVIDNEVLETNEQTDTHAETEQEQAQPEKTFTQAELDDIVAKRLAREEKKRAEAVKEAEKLAQMNEQQKKDYEFEKLQEEIAALKAENNRNAMRDEASKMLNEQGINVDSGILAFVVGDTAEQTKDNVDSFTALFKSELDKAVQEHFKSNGREIKQAAGTHNVPSYQSIEQIAAEANIRNKF